MSCTDRRRTGFRSPESPERLRLPESLVPLRSQEPPERLRLPEPWAPLQSPSLLESPGLQALPDSTG
jgi:hypothetical protein